MCEKKNKKGLGHFIFGALFGFSLALSFHPSNWGRVSGASFAFIFGIICISSMTLKWRSLLFLIIPIGFFLPVTYVSVGIDSWMQNPVNAPAKRAGDVIYYISTTAKSIALEQKSSFEEEFCEHYEAGSSSEDCEICMQLQSDKPTLDERIVNAEVNVWWLWLAILCISGFLSMAIYDMRDSRRKEED